MSSPLRDAESATSTGPAARTGNSALGDVRVNLNRWNRKAIRNPTPVVLEVVVGAFSLLLFTAVFGEVGEFALAAGGFGDIEYVTFLLPAVVLQATMGSAFTSGVGLVSDLESGMFEKIAVTPMSWTAVFAGKAASELLRIVLQVLVVVALGIAMGATIETGPLGVVGVVLVCLLVGLLFMAIANIIAVLTRDEEALNAASLLFTFPLLFLSPAFLPLSSLSSSVETVATINPVTYGVDAVRALVLGRDVMTVVSVSRFGGVYDTLIPAVAVLVAANLICGAVAVALLARASSSSVE